MFFFDDQFGGTFENNNQLYLRAEKELEAHIQQFCSTIEYFKTTEYELPTPSQLGDRADYFFRRSVIKKKHSYIIQ